MLYHYARRNSKPTSLPVSGPQPTKPDQAACSLQASSLIKPLHTAKSTRTLQPIPSIQPETGRDFRSPKESRSTLGTTANAFSSRISPKHSNPAHTQRISTVTSLTATARSDAWIFKCGGRTPTLYTYRNTVRVRLYSTVYPQKSTLNTQ